MKTIIQFRPRRTWHYCQLTVFVGNLNDNKYILRVLTLVLGMVLILQQENEELKSNKNRDHVIKQTPIYLYSTFCSPCCIEPGWEIKVIQKLRPFGQTNSNLLYWLRTFLSVGNIWPMKAVSLPIYRYT
jgi:hypothetical protein